jgi:hypothetical protein
MRVIPSMSPQLVQVITRSSTPEVFISEMVEVDPVAILWGKNIVFVVETYAAPDELLVTPDMSKAETTLVKCVTL